MTDITELEQLKQRADKMGIKYHHAVGKAKLSDLIDREMKGIQDNSKDPAKDTYKTESQLRGEANKKAGRLVRVNITNMNPNKKAWQGEVYTVSNSVVGTFKKFIPWGVDWHIPEFILPTLQEKEYRQDMKSKDRNGYETSTWKMNKELAINILPDLTSKELEKLGKIQAMSKGEDI